MNIKVYAFRFAVAAAAFGLAIGLIGVGRYLQNIWRTKPPEIAATRLSVEKKTADFKKIIQNAEDEAAQNKADSEATYEFDGEGEYYIPGDIPKGFNEFGAIQIETRDWEADSDEFPCGKPIPPQGHIFHKEKFHFKRIGIANRQIALETENVKGISYKFAGSFLKESIYDEKNKASIMLEGRLTKLKNGKKIAESDLRLAVNETCGC